MEPFLWGSPDVSETLHQLLVFEQIVPAAYKVFFSGDDSISNYFASILLSGECHNETEM
jgi:hypothetical protein